MLWEECAWTWGLDFMVEYSVNVYWEFKDISVSRNAKFKTSRKWCTVYISQPLRFNTCSFMICRPAHLLWKHRRSGQYSWWRWRPRSDGQCYLYSYVYLCVWLPTTPCLFWGIKVSVSSYLYMYTEVHVQHPLGLVENKYICLFLCISIVKY